MKSHQGFSIIKENDDIKLMNYVLKEMSSGNNYLLSFFDELFNEYNRIKDKKIEDLKKEADNLENSIDYFPQLFSELIESLNKKNIEIIDNGANDYIFFDKNKICFCLNGFMIPFDYFLNKEVSEDFDINSLIQKKSNVNIEINKMKESINKIEKKIFKTKKELMELRAIRIDLNEKMQEESELNEIIDLLITINNLSSNEKDLIEKCINISKEIINKRNKVCELRFEFDKYCRNYSVELLSDTISSLLENNRLSKKDFDRVLSIIDSYKNKSISNKMHFDIIPLKEKNRVIVLKDFVCFFLQNIYNNKDKIMIDDNIFCLKFTK